ncbi:MAG TPA: hypothetical protein VJ764_05840 [Steroidobacteraceae bacterium]|nr:hypothetical protein [Steroidobacteraceae bacterium]
MREVIVVLIVFGIFLAVMLLSGCTLIEGECTREVTVRNECKSDGRVIVLPPAGS